MSVPAGVDRLFVDTSSREQVRCFFNAVHAASSSAAPEWTGSLGGGQAGTTSREFRELVLLRINFFRAMAGVPAAVALDEAASFKAQQAALMMAVNQRLSHYPTTDWIAYTADGAEAAGRSNLSLGSCGPEAIDGYMEDYGVNNAAVGHRRWLLYPQTESMGTGDVPSVDGGLAANATWAVDDNYWQPRPQTVNAFVSWPPPGFVPYSLVFPRWSFSLREADFSSTTVTMSRDGQALPVTVEPNAPNIGENTLVWRVGGVDAAAPFEPVRPAGDVVYRIGLDRVTVGGVSQSYEYTVVAFDPALPGPDTVVPVLTGAPRPPIGCPAEYTIKPVPVASGYEVRRAEVLACPATEGAEHGTGSLVPDVTPGYSVVVNSPRASGSQAFRLAHPPQPRDQCLTFAQTFLAGPAARFTFRSRLCWATPTQWARVEISKDDGKSWTGVYEQAGDGGQGEDTFQLREATLGGLAAQTFKLRLNYHYSRGGYFPQTDTGVGWHLDDLTFHDVQPLGAPEVIDSGLATTFSWAPDSVAPRIFQVRAQAWRRYSLEWGPVLWVEPVIAPVLVLDRRLRNLDGVFQVQFAATNLPLTAVLRLQRTTHLGAAWVDEPDARLEAVAGRYSFHLPAVSAPGFYRVKAE